MEEEEERELKVGDRKAFCPIVVENFHEVPPGWNVDSSLKTVTGGEMLTFFGNEDYCNGSREEANYIPHKYLTSDINFLGVNAIWLLELVESCDEFGEGKSSHSRVRLWRPVISD